MKWLIIILLLLPVSSWSQDVWDYTKVKHWRYDIKVEIIILMPEDFRVARDYYFDINKHPERGKYVAFTTWYLTKGELKPYMFLQARMNIQPLNDDIGHEMKHIINWKHKMDTGEFLYALPCDDWK